MVVHRFPTTWSTGTPRAVGAGRRHEWWLEHDGADVSVLVLEAPSGSATTPNAWLVLPREPGVRLVAVAGAAPAPGAPTFCGLDGATWAAQVTRAALLADDDVAACLWRANQLLHDPTLLRAGARPQAAAVIADVRNRWDGDATAHVVRAADSAAYARFGARWSPVFPCSHLTAEAARMWDGWKAAHSGASIRERIAAEDRALGAPAAWRTAPVGRFAEPMVECTDIEGFDELVLASHGAHIDPERLDEIDDYRPSRDDVSIVRWRRFDTR